MPICALEFLVLTFAGWVNRHQDDLIAYLREESRVLREQLGISTASYGSTPNAVDSPCAARQLGWKASGRRSLASITPETIHAANRRLIAQTYDGSARRGRGRPMTRRDVAALVVRMAVEHPQWGDTRIRGALSNLGHEIARTTVKRILHDHGIDPAPERSRHIPWKTFLQAHWEGLAACDLFTVEVLTLAGLRRYLVFFVIARWSAVPPRDHRRDPSAAVRRVDGADGPQSDGPGRWLFATRPLSDSRSRPALHADLRRGILEGGGVQPIRLPPKSRPISTPMPSGSSARQEMECLSRVGIPLGEGAHHGSSCASTSKHYHRERHHQGLDKQLLQRPPPPVSLAADGAAAGRLGGPLNFYHREATGVVGRLNAPYALRALARRWMALTEEMALHDQHLARLTTETSPTLREGFGVGAHTAAELLIIFGDNPDRIRSEAAFAKLCGACPIPASSGRTTGRHRLYRGGHPTRQRRPLSSRHRPHAIPPTNPRLRRPTYRRWPDHTRDHPMPETLPFARDLPTRHDRLPHTPSRHPGRLKRVS